MSDDDPWELWGRATRKERAQSELRQGLAPGAARGSRRPPQTSSRSDQRQAHGARWTDSLLTSLTRARSVPELLWASTTLSEERSFAAGVAVGLLSALAGLVTGPVDLVRMFVLAELYESIDGPWRRALRSARGLPGPLGMLAFGSLLGNEYAALHAKLREAFEERERFIGQLELLISHPLRFLGELTEEVASALKRKWQRYQLLRRQHNLDSQYEAGKIFGELIGEVALLVWPLSKAAKAGLAKELPDLAQRIERVGAGKVAGKKAGKAGAGAESAAADSGGGGTQAASKGGGGAAKSEPPSPAVGPSAEKAGPAESAAPAGGAASEGNPVPRDQLTQTGHPVDVATGKVFTDKLDLELPGVLGLRWERVWFSTSTHAGPLGHGWHHSYDASLLVEPDAVHYRTADGRSVRFEPLQLGQERLHRTERATLLRDALGYALRTHDQQLQRFSALRADPKLHVLSAIEHPAGRRLQLQHDALGRLRELIDGSGRSITFEYDAGGRMTTLSVPHPDRPAERLVALRYGYDAHGNLARVADALGRDAIYAYSQHQLVQETDRTGLSFYFEYDSVGPKARCTRTWGDDGIYDHKLSYDVTGGITTVENSLGEKTLYQHRSGLVLRTVDPLGATSLIDYDEYNRKRLETDALGRETRYFYDAGGNLERVIRPDGEQLHAAYDQYNRLQRVTDASGAQWAFTHDHAGRLTTRVDPLGGRVQYGYEGANLTEIHDPAGQRFRIAYDEQGNPTELHAPDGGVQRWSYDGLGRARTACDPLGNAQVLTRDLLGRVVHVREPDGNVRTLEYDGEGNLLQAKDKHRTVQLTYQGLGRLASRREAGTTVYFQYDTEERLRAIHNEDGRAYRFELGLNGKVEVEQGWDGSRRVLKRDLLGRISELQRPSGRTSRYSYDALNRIVAIQHSDGVLERFGYDAEGRLTSADNGSSQLQFQRDALGRVQREIQNQHWVESDYDPRGLRGRIRSSLGADQHIGRDARGGVLAIDAGAFQARFSRDLLGLELERTLPGGARSRWQRDKLGRPVAHELLVGERPVRSSRYGWDVDGRLLQLIDSEHGLVRYGYDARSRLAWARYNDGSAELRLPDAVANLYRSEDRKDRVYGRSGELLEATDRRGRVSKYRYDPDGNLCEKQEPEGQCWQYGWNDAGHLIRVTRPDGSEVHFRYDAFGRRIQKRYRGQTTYFVWDGDVPLHEWVEGELLPLAPSSAQAASQAHAIKQREAELQAHLAQGPPERGSAIAPITWLFEPESHAPMAKLLGERCHAILTDHLGTPKAMVDSRGSFSWAASITTYGELRHLRGQRHACPFRWAGQYEDAETGLHYNRHRYYDPTSGQYISQDPIRLAGGQELYAYCADPLGSIDPLGLCGEGSTSSATPGTYTPDRTLPTDKQGVPTPDSEYPHTQLGRSKPKYGSEAQAREWDHGSNGNLQPKRDIDFSDHGTPDIHPNPHQHELTPNNSTLAPKGGFQRGPAKPL